MIIHVLVWIVIVVGIFVGVVTALGKGHGYPAQTPKEPKKEKVVKRERTIRASGVLSKEDLDEMEAFFNETGK